MTPIFAKRIVADLIPCGLAAVVLFLAACAKAPPRPSPPAINSGAAASRSEEAVRATETAQAKVSHPPVASEEAEDSTRAPNELNGNIEGLLTDDTGARYRECRSHVDKRSDRTGPDGANKRVSESTTSGTCARVPIQFRADPPGFKLATRSGVQVESGQSIRIDLVLQVRDGIPIIRADLVSRLEGLPGGVLPPLSPFFNTQKYGIEEYGIVNEPGFSSVVNRPLSTFFIDVDTASYALLRAFLRDGRLPPVDAVHIEELINNFDYDYPEPEEGVPFAIIAEIGACPWSSSHRLVHIGLRSKPVATANLPPANLVFLLDVSGSMYSEDKLPLLKKSFSLLTRQLRPQDRISVVVYAGGAEAEMVLPPTSGAQRTKILAAVSDLLAGRPIAVGSGIRLAYKLARESFIEAGNNRVILVTDGDFDIGVSSEEELVKLIERERETGIFLSILGFGMGNLKDSKMEKLAGKGNYSYIDSPLEARRELVKQMGATLPTVAKDVQFQVEFNPKQVKAYRLIGHPYLLLRDKDAGDMTAGHSVTALYEIIPAGSAEPLPGVDPLKYQRTTVPTSAGRPR